MVLGPGGDLRRSIALERFTGTPHQFAVLPDGRIVVPTNQIDERIKESYGTDSASMDEVLKQLGEAGDLLQIRGDESAAAVEAEANATPIIRLSPNSS